MKVLLIAIPFYGYEFKIKKTLELLGNEVDFFYDQKEKIRFDRFVSEEKRIKIHKKYQEDVLKSISHDYDIVLVIVGRWLSSDFLIKVRRKNLKARFVLYLWDDVARVQNFNEVKEQYDKIFSFDTYDCEKYGFEFLPLFYRDECTISTNFKEFDIYGSYWVHSDRMNVISQIIKKYPMYRCNFYLYTSYYEYLKSRIKSTPMSKFMHPVTLNFADNLNNMCKSKSLLDIQHPTQRGLTIRTIEAIGCGVKLITTNSEVKKYDFYTQDNIWIIDRNNIEIPNSFFESPYKPLPNVVYEKYSLKSWCKQVLY